MTSPSPIEERSVYFTSADGLKLFARDWGPKNGAGLPVLCLAGLTRNSRDFEPVVPFLAKTHRVIAPDYRGRGRSQYATNWKTYEPPVEMADAIALLDHLGIEKVALIGTSRGGLIAMLMGQFHKSRLAGVFFNDIGPKLENSGLIEIAKSIKMRTSADSWQKVIAGLKEYNHKISGLSEHEWEAFAKRLFIEKDGKIIPDYDHNLMKTFPDVEFIQSGRIPQVWELYETLSDLPVGLARGAHSDLLSRETVAKMARLHPGLISVEVPGRAHVPFLDEKPCVDAIQTWLQKCDAGNGDK